ncbi:MAG: hypothetical protein ACI3Y0_07815 [Prevotella sp.]
MEYKELLNNAIGRFWDTRGSQRSQNATEDDNRGELIRERKYTSVALLWTNVNRQYGDVCQDLAMDNFICSFVGHLKGWENEFK